MVFTPTNILLFGATGVIGKPIAEQLGTQKDAFGRLGIFTSPSTVANKPDVIQDLQSLGFDIFAGDINDVSFGRGVLTGEQECLSHSTPNPRIPTHGSTPFDTIVSAVGRNAITSAQIPLLELAESLPTVKRFFPSEYGTDVEFDETSATEPPHQQKLQVRAFVASSIARLEVTYLVTGPYSDLFLSKMSAAPETGTFDVQAKQAVLLFDGEGPVSFTSMADVAKLLVCALKKPSSTRVQALKLNSFTATPRQIVSEFEKQTASNWQVSCVPAAEFREFEAKAYATKSPLATMYTLRRIWAEGKTLCASRDNERLGFVEAETLEQAVAKALVNQGDAFRSGEL